MHSQQCKFQTVDLCVSLLFTIYSICSLFFILFLVNSRIYTIALWITPPVLTTFRHTGPLAFIFISLLGTIARRDPEVTWMLCWHIRLIWTPLCLNPCWINTNARPSTCRWSTVMRLMPLWTLSIKVTVISTFWIIEVINFDAERIQRQLAGGLDGRMDKYS